MPIEELDKLIAEVQTIPEFKVELIDIAKRVLKNMRIGSLIDKLTSSLGSFEVEVVKMCIDIIN